MWFWRGIEAENSGKLNKWEAFWQKSSYQWLHSSYHSSIVFISTQFILFFKIWPPRDKVAVWDKYLIWCFPSLDTSNHRASLSEEFSWRIFTLFQYSGQGMPRTDSIQKFIRQAFTSILFWWCLHVGNIFFSFFFCSLGRQQYTKLHVILGQLEICSWRALMFHLYGKFTNLSADLSCMMILGSSSQHYFWKGKTRDHLL